MYSTFEAAAIFVTVVTTVVCAAITLTLIFFKSLGWIEPSFSGCSIAMVAPVVVSILSVGVRLLDGLVHRVKDKYWSADASEKVANIFG